MLNAANVYWIFPLAIANGVLGAFTSPAMRGIIPEIVDSKDINQANSLMNTSKSAAKIIGPTLAGVFVATLGGGWGIAIDGVSFLLAAVCMVQVRVVAHPVISDQSLVRQLQAGWSYFRHHRWIWSITLAYTVINLVNMGVWRVPGPIIAEHSFGSVGWGLTLSVNSVGLLIASLAMLKFHLKRPLRDGLIANAAAGLPLIMLGQGESLSVLAITAAFAGAGSVIGNIAWDSSLQQAVPQQMLSRIFAFDEFGSFIAIPIGVILAVPLADTFGYQTAATAGGIIFIVMALLPLSEKWIRTATTKDLQELKEKQAELYKGS